MSFVDRKVQYPNRKRLTPVSGQANVYDITDEPGEVYDAGTPLTASRLNFSGNDRDVQYICNGTNDNVGLSALSQRFFNRQGEFSNYSADASLYVYVNGNVGIERDVVQWQPDFTFGIPNYQGNQRLYINWENAHFDNVDFDICLRASTIYSMISNVGEGYIEHIGAKIDMQIDVNIPLAEYDYYGYSLDYAIFSGSHGKYVDCDCKIAGNLYDYGEIYTGASNGYDRWDYYYCDFKAYDGQYNTYQHCDGTVFSDSYSFLYVAVNYHYYIELDSFAFCGSCNTYSDCTGFAFAHAESGFYPSAISASASVQAAGAYCYGDSEFHNCTFGAKYTYFYGSGEGGYGIYNQIYSWGGNNQYSIIDNCKFPLTTFIGTSENFGQNYNAQPICITGNVNMDVHITDNIFSNQLLASSWPSNATASGNITANIYASVNCND